MGWLFIRLENEADFPDMPIIIQSALNTVSQIAEGESWVQNLMKICQQCEMQKLPNGDINVKKVCMQVQKSQPPRPQDVPDLVDFVRTWGGLPSCVHIHEHLLLSQTFPSDRVVTGNFFKWLTQLKKPFRHQEHAKPFDTCHGVHSCRG